MPNFEIELGLLKQGYKSVAGVDEVGRGALAGPIVAAAVVFNGYEDLLDKLNGIDDSKKLSPKKRAELDPVIRELAGDVSIGEVSVEEIDKFGIGAANVMAFERALDGLKKIDFVLIDGRKFRGFRYSYRCLEKGESKSLSIAAASIVAKVYRDDLMVKLHDEISEYDFKSNKGYGGKKHYAKLFETGPSKHHRKSFLKFLDKTQISLDI